MSEVLQFYKDKSIQKKISCFKRLTFSFKTPKLFFMAHRFLFRITNGLWNDMCSKIISITSSPEYKIKDVDSQILGPLSKKQITDIALQIERDGCYVFEQKIKSEIVDQLVKLCEETPAHGLKAKSEYNWNIEYDKKPKPLDELVGTTTRMQFNMEELIQDHTIQKVIFDEMFFAVSQAYLKCKPILDSLLAWWSYPVKDADKFSSAAAQKFHSDLDRIKLLKFLIYLTDVGSENGPHTFVKTSQKNLPSQFRKRGRIEDDSVDKVYKSNVTEFTGARGTILAVDTRGLHKGKIPTDGRRLVLQVQYTNSLFGAYYPTFSINNLNHDQQGFIKRYYKSFFSYF